MVAQKLVFWLANSQWSKVSDIQGCLPVVSRCCGGSQTRTLSRKFPMAQILIQSGMSPSGIWVLWWLTNPYFESQITNGSKSHTVRDVPQWYLGAVVAQKPVLCIANCQWFKVSYSRGCPPMVFGCSGGSKTRTLYRRFRSGSNSQTVSDVPQWSLGALLAQKLVL